MVFAVIGGDERQAALIKSLASDGHEVRAYGLEKAEGVVCGDSVENAVSGAGYVILPLPFSKGGNDIVNAPLSGYEISLRDVFSHAVPGQIFFIGKTNGYADELAGKAHVNLKDYSSREDFQILNAEVTAEGAVQLLLENMPVTLSGSKCLVIGFGRIGKLLAHKLKNLGSSVAVSARKCSDAAWINAYGLKSEDTGKLEGRLSEYDAVINTVPSLILNEKRLFEIRGFLLDLASKPGGVDFEAAERLGVKTVWAPGLPGKTAPESAGSIIKHTLYNIIAEQGCVN